MAQQPFSDLQEQTAANEQCKPLWPYLPPWTH
jgi:hypothetical protein